ncbi:MAG: hypothetical protein HY369_04085 [Candidatus Aenigmarchaeota archaeon]|nr:hypothetical protein [Candidatus Aenigmarchaeota archaeon]
MFYAGQETYAALHEAGIIDKRLPNWWSLGFEGRRYVSPDEFRGRLQDVRGMRVYCGPDDRDILFTVVPAQFRELEVPVFVTAKPLDAYWQELIEREGWDPDHVEPFAGESHPHARGIALASTPEVFFWYPTKAGLGTAASCGDLALWDISAQDPLRFFSKLVSYHVLPSRRTYQRREPLDSPDQVPWVPFYDFSTGEGRATIVPSVRGSCPHLPTLVRQGENGPVVRGFTDGKTVYTVHPKARKAVRESVEDLLGVACDVAL